MPIQDVFGPAPFIYTFLDQLAAVLRGAPKPEGIRVVAAILDRAKVTEEALQDAFVSIMEEEDRFPVPAVILRHARRRQRTAQPTEESRADAIEEFNRQTYEAELAWLKVFEARGDDYHIRICRKKLGLFDSARERRARREYDPRDLIEIGGTKQGWPNRVSLVGFTGDETYLHAHGARWIPEEVLTQVRNGFVRKAMP